MIFLDHRTGSVELLPYLRQLHVPVDITTLEFGDAAFEGKGPGGHVLIGLERKTLHDFLQCIDDSRYAGHQRPGMAAFYNHSYLIIEGKWTVGTPPYYAGVLLEQKKEGWVPLRYRTQRVMYAKLRRYLFSVGLGGVQILYTQDKFHTAQDIVEAYHYWQKPWEGHTSLRETHKLNLPTLQRRPSLTRLWASAIDGIGVQKGEDAERLFRSPLELAMADEAAWLKVPHVGVKTAQRVVRQIRGGKR